MAHRSIVPVVHIALPVVYIALLWGLLLPGCGPQVLGGDDAGGSGSADETSGAPSSTSAPPPGTSSTSAADTSTGPTTLDPDTTDDPSGMIPDPDGIGDGYTCDLAQDCPRGEKCMPWANDGGVVHNSTRCSPLASDAAQAGEPCMVEGNAFLGIDDCDLGLVCFEVDPETNLGVCRELCGSQAGGAMCSDPETACIEWYDGGLPVCSPAPCDPHLQDCGPGMGCYGEPIFECDVGACGYQTGMVEQGAACEWVNDCNPGWQCVDGAGVPGCASERCCTRICDTDEPGSCDAVPGTQCTFQGPGGTCPPMLLDVGVCVTE